MPKGEVNELVQAAREVAKLEAKLATIDTQREDVLAALKTARARIQALTRGE